MGRWVHCDDGGGLQHLPECEKLAKEGQLQEVIETLLSLEKQTPTASDMVSTSRNLVVVVKNMHI